MTTHEHLIESVLQSTQNFNCGSSIITLLPSLFYFFYFWRLSETYIIAYMNPIQRPRRLHRMPKGLWWKFWLKVPNTKYFHNIHNKYIFLILFLLKYNNEFYYKYFFMSKMS